MAYMMIKMAFLHIVLFLYLGLREKFDNAAFPLLFSGHTQLGSRATVK